MKVSIIIPVYNAESYLKQTIESIIIQTYSKLEVILVNDGSTDRSRDICVDYQTKDNRIKLISIPNSGPGVARNIGISEATGEYISFVDADDSLSMDAIEILLTTALTEDYDIVSCNHFRVDETEEVSRNNYQTGEIKRRGEQESIRRFELFKTSSSFGYVWGKLYKRKFLMTNNILFSEQRKIFLEDTLFNLKSFVFDPKYYVLNTPIYYYNILSDSLSNTKEQVTDKAIEMLESYEHFLDQQDKYSENLDLFILLSVRTIAWALFKVTENKFNFKMLYETVREFSTNSTIRRVFSCKEVLKEVRNSRDIFQIILYSFIILCIKYKMDILLALTFFIAYPLFKIYIKKVLKS